VNPTMLVTGASRGIGRAIARLLAARGHDVVGVARGPATDLGVRWLCADLTQPEAAASLVGELSRLQVRLQGIVLNAGITARAPFDAPQDGTLAEQLRVNLEAPLSLLHALLRGGLDAPSLSIVAITSNLGHRGVPHKVAYAASKGGLEAAVRGLAHELGPRGIRVNAVAPGLVRTDMIADLGTTALEAYASEVPLRRLGDVDDVAPLVAFLLGPESAYITGQIIDVDGGWRC